MAMETLPTRVDRLEDIMAELTANVNQLTIEMREYKEESRREMHEFREEMRGFKDAMSVFEYEARREMREMRQSIAQAYQKMGTLAEDLVAPSVPRILERVIDCSEEPEMLGVRMRKRLPDGRSQEYDVVAICDDFLLINETKSRLSPEDMPAFVERLEQVREFFPEYADKRVIGALATFYVDQSLVVHGERQGLIMLGVIGGLLEVLNRAGFEPKVF